jgi:DNA invertase Pin-like site-specific DNA recombinase
MSQARTATPRVYSYLRFSSPGQARGDSERRQRDRFEAAKDFARRKGLEFDETLDLNDRGLSAYSGAHRKRGAMGRFLKLVESGRIARRSALMVEDVDRLSREGPGKALRTIIFKLWDHDITLATADPPAEYEPGCEDTPQFLLLILLLDQAHKASARKSRLVAAAKAAGRKRAREGGVFTANCPRWLRLGAAGKFEVIPEGAAAVARLFDLYLSGLGPGAIARQMNREGGWSPPSSGKRVTTGWRLSYVRKVLDSRTVIGEYQPHKLVNGRRVPDGEPIANYYPACVRPQVFFAAQARLEANRGRGGQTGRVHNLFPHLARCAYCGAPMTLVNTGGPRPSWLACDNRKRGLSCPRPNRVRYAEVEKLVLDNLPGLRPEDILPQPGDRARELQALRDRLEGRDGELRDIGQQTENFLDQMGRTKDRALRDRIEARIGRLQQRAAQLQTEADEDRQRLAAAERGRAAVEDWQRDLNALAAALAGGDPDTRLKARAHLREFIDRVEVFGSGHRTVYRAADVAAAFDRVVGPAWAAAQERGVREGDYASDPVVHEALDRVHRDPGYIEAAVESDQSPEYVRWLAGRVGMPAAEAAAFTEYVLSRRLSWEGRFVRVHFRAGVSVDLVPAGSIATGWSMAEAVKHGWQGRGTDPDNVRPDLPQLYDDWKAGRRPKRWTRRKVEPVPLRS